MESTPAPIGVAGLRRSPTQKSRSASAAAWDFMKSIPGFSAAVTQAQANLKAGNGIEPKDLRRFGHDAERHTTEVVVYRGDGRLLATIPPGSLAEMVSAMSGCLSRGPKGLTGVRSVSPT